MTNITYPKKLSSSKINLNSSNIDICRMISQYDQKNETEIKNNYMKRLI